MAEWVPVHEKRCPEATYDALKVEAKTITADYDSLSIYCMAERRPQEGVRLMLKVKSPDSKICQAGSHVFPVSEKGLCPKNAHVYLDMLHVLVLVCQHEEADLQQLRAWHEEVKRYARPTLGYLID